MACLIGLTRGSHNHAVEIHDPNWRNHSHRARKSVCGTLCGVNRREFKLGDIGNCKRCERAMRAREIAER